ncbi:hypothetical protein RHOSPDRAFT_27912 [Rhodotorula sp. JG-1b]|nr:hypothetical protein RHOSPDRAFT_27912 [Rhodotorula sp. JG-1b]
MTPTPGLQEHYPSASPYLHRLISRALLLKVVERRKDERAYARPAALGASRAARAQKVVQCDVHFVHAEGAAQYDLKARVIYLYDQENAQAKEHQAPGNRNLTKSSLRAHAQCKLTFVVIRLAATVAKCRQELELLRGVNSQLKPLWEKQEKCIL